MLESREADQGAAVRRRRVCGGCGHRFTTFERTEHAGLMISRGDGSKQPFSRRRLRRALSRTARRERLAEPDLDALVRWIETSLMTEHGIVTVSKLEELSDAGLRELGGGAGWSLAPPGEEV